jgi:hypothetical protein
MYIAMLRICITRRKLNTNSVMIFGENKVYEHTVSSGNPSLEEKLVDTVDCVNKFFTGKAQDKEKMINALKMNERKAKKYIEESQRLKEKIKRLEKELSEEKKKKNKTLDRLDKYEQVLFTWLTASSNSNVPLINLITTGKSRHPIVDIMFDTIFSENPLEGYERIEHFKNKIYKDTNVVHLDNRIVKNTLIDDFDL